MPDVDRSKLQRDILELVQQHGARAGGATRRRHPPLPPLLAAIRCWLRASFAMQHGLPSQDAFQAPGTVCLGLASSGRRSAAPSRAGSQPPLPPPKHPAAHKPATLPPAADMAPIYEEVCQELGTSSDGAALAGMRESNAKRLAELEEKIKDAGGALTQQPCASSQPTVPVVRLTALSAAPPATQPILL